MNRIYTIIISCLFTCSLQGQKLPSFHFLSDDLNEVSLEFIDINNLIILPVSLNGSDTLFFILDSGAENIILFASEFETLPIDTNYLRKVRIAGVGNNDAISAYVSPLNRLELGQIRGENQNILFIPDNQVKFSDLLGHPVHGILGIPIFNSFVIELNYTTKRVTFYNKETFEVNRKFKTIDLNIIGSRPYIEVNIELQPRINLFTNLLLDSGESKPLSLFLNSNELMFIPYPNYSANLGKGLNGLITGKIAKIGGVTLDEFVLNDVITAFPDEENIIHITDIEERNGSLGAGILKKFISIIDINKEKLYLRRTKFYNQPFKFDKTGLVIIADGENYNHYKVTGVIEGSSGEKAGILENDVVLKINGNELSQLKYGEVLQLIDDGGRKMNFEIERKGKIQKFTLRTYRL